MKTIHLTINNLETLFKQLKLNFGGSIKKEGNEYLLEINNKIGIGKITGVMFIGDILHISFSMIYFKDINIIINTPKTNPLYFVYPSTGKLEHRFKVEEKKNILKRFQTGILANNSDDKNIFFFKKDKQLEATFIIVNTNIYTKSSENNRLKKKLHKTFFNKNDQKNFIHISSQNLKIFKKIEQINSLKQKGLVKNLLIQGLVNIILALEVQQHTSAINNDKKIGNLIAREAEIIKKASQFVKSNFNTPLSIKQLCSKFGITASKLQEGFKLMHGCTVSNYIKNVRIQKSEEFIKNTDMNISEVVYSIGFSSRSYFSKIFKEKYGSSPSEYKDA